MNLVILTGTLDDDPKVHRQHPDKGSFLALLNMRCRNPVSGKNVDWHKVVARGRVAKWCGEHLSKGMRITVIGQLEWSRWKDKKTKALRKRAQVLCHSIHLPAFQWQDEWLELALMMAKETIEQGDTDDDEEEETVDETEEEEVESET